MKREQRRDRQLYTRPIRHLFVFVLTVLLVSQLAIGMYAWSLTEAKFLPELGRKAHTVGTSIASKLTRALGYGIPLQRIEGAQEFFGEVLEQNDDIAFIALSDMQGKLLFQRGERANALDVAVPVLHDGARVAQLHVGVDRGYIASRIRELRYDIGIVLLTSLLIAFEILWFVVTLNFSAPMRQIIELMTRMASGDFRNRAITGSAQSLAAALNRIEKRINDVFAQLATTAPAPVLQTLRGRYRFAENGTARDLVQRRVVVVRILGFLFMFAEMLSRPFLPLYAGGLPDPGLGMSDGLRASLPITAFLLGVALSMPFAGRWSDRLGRRNSYLAGASFVALGLACTGLVPDYVVLVLARAATGVGYALMFMACQGYVLDTSDARDSGKGMALFVGAIMVAEICAPAVGGILADRIGYRLVFVAGTVVALIAAGIAATVLDNRGAGQVPARPGQGGLAALLRNRRFLLLALVSGVPAKFLYSGFLIFLVPVLLSGLGSSKSDIGRYTMLYGLLALALAPVFAHLADRHNAYAPLVGLGGLVTGLGMLPVLAGAAPDTVMLGIAALGLGQSMSISAQLVLVTRVTQAESQVLGKGQVLGVFRLLERLGAAAGPVAAGALVAAYGAPHAMAILGGLALLSTTLFAVVFLIPGSGRAGARA